MNRQLRLISAGFLALLVVAGAPLTAHAGVGTSTGCTDGITTAGGTEFPILNTVLTFSVEGGGSPPYLQVCYSSTTEGDPSPAFTGGWIYVILDPANPQVSCNRDFSPTVVGLDCFLRDDSFSSPGRTFDVTLWIQNVPVRLVAGVELGTPGPVACLFDAVVYTPAGAIGPVDIGVCA